MVERDLAKVDVEGSTPFVRSILGFTVFISPNLSIPESLKQQIIDFALNSGVDYFVNNGQGRRFCNLNRIDSQLSQKVREFSNYCYGNYGISVVEEPMFGNFIGVNTRGAFVHPHRDPRSNQGMLHVRLNFILSLPHSGGQPVIEGQEYTVVEDQCWLNLASEWQHQSTPVQGEKPRIVLSLGSYVAEDDVKSFRVFSA